MTESQPKAAAEMVADAKGYIADLSAEQVASELDREDVTSSTSARMTSAYRGKLFLTLCQSF